VSPTKAFSIAGAIAAVFVLFCIVLWRTPPPLPPAVAGSLCFSGLLCVVFLVLFVLEIAQYGSIAIKSQWGGIGGGLGGWRLSRPLTYLASGLFFGGLTVTVSFHYFQSQHERRIAQENQSFELQKLREADDRKYRDAQQARESDVEKIRFAAQNTDSRKSKSESQPAVQAKTGQVSKAN